jgi:cell division protein FtsB
VSRSPLSRSATKRREKTLAHRRARALLIGAACFSVLVLATSMPVSALLSQKSQLASAQSQLGAVESENHSLQAEASQLKSPSTLSEIARRDYGLVSPGSEAYEILPTSGSSSAAATASGHVPLDGPPVVPGSAQSEALLGAGALLTSGSPGSGGAGVATAPKSRSASRAGGGEPGFWSRVASTLEFWH